MSDSTKLNKNALSELQDKILKLKYENSDSDVVDILSDYECFADSRVSTTEGYLPSCYIVERRPWISSGIAALINLLGAAAVSTVKGAESLMNLLSAAIPINTRQCY